MHIIWLCSKI